MDAPCYVKVNAEQFIHRLLHDRYRYKRTLYIYIPGIQVWPTKLYIPTYYQCSSAGKFGKRRSYITNTITHVLVLCTSVIHTIWYKSFHIYYKVYLSKNKKKYSSPISIIVQNLQKRSATGSMQYRICILYSQW